MLLEPYSNLLPQVNVLLAFVMWYTTVAVHVSAAVFLTVS